MNSTTLVNWQRAAVELDFCFVSPFEFGPPDARYSCFAHVPEFGSANGMIVMLEYDQAMVRAAQTNGFGYSCLTDSSEPYNAQDFIDVLNDWGWTCNNKTAPSWYTGAPWSN